MRNFRNPLDQICKPPTPVHEFDCPSRIPIRCAKFKFDCRLRRRRKSRDSGQLKRLWNTERSMVSLWESHLWCWWLLDCCGFLCNCGCQKGSCPAAVFRPPLEVIHPDQKALHCGYRLRVRGGFTSVTSLLLSKPGTGEIIIF
jgi:hypothetical protein